MNHWKDRFKAAGIHLALSLLVAGMAALLVFGIWYPHPYREISGGRELFLLVVAVDVLLGPLCTLVIFNRAKPRRELLLDFCVIGLFQIGALAYGLWTVHAARPVHLVFEYDRFRVVHAIEVPKAELPDAQPSLHALPLTGPTLLALRPLQPGNEQFQMTMQAMEGVSLSARPGLWRPYETARPAVLAVARPVGDLKARFARQTAAIDEAVTQTGRNPDTLAYVPMVGRKSFWTVLVDAKTAQPLAYLPLDSF
jgi:hypothetical protein